MTGSSKMTDSHRQRLAIVYVRQSDPRQVRHHRESGINQRALQQRVRELGWPSNRIRLIDDDQGQSGRSADGREGFQRLVADVSLGKVGMVMGTEVSRLSRNSADWYRLLELCALFDTLIADADGIYHPREFNDRILLGLKGTLSEAELHSLRLRLDAGRLSKAKRGELVQHLPTGYRRQPDGGIDLDPDASARDRLRLVFTTFAELGSMQKVVRFLVRHHLRLPRRQTSGLDAGQVLWKRPSTHTLYSLLKNPAYAGAFVYGRRIADPAGQTPGRPATGRLRQPAANWIAIVPGVYPGYVTWDQYQHMQATMAENRQAMTDRMTRRQAFRTGAALLPGLVRCGRCGHAMRVSYKGDRVQYVCVGAKHRAAGPTCQHLAGHRLDEAVTQAFFAALRPASIDALDRVTAGRAAHHREVLAHLEQEVTRLEYAAQRAERQYDRVDPENRLIAATLEAKWEAALAEWERAKARLGEERSRTPPSAPVPPAWRAAFADVGPRLPEVWPRVTGEARKRLLRTLVTGVNLRREDDGVVRIRIVWVGGEVCERAVRLPISSRLRSGHEAKIVTRIRELVNDGHRDDGIAERLNAEGLTPCRGERFTGKIVRILRNRHHVALGLAGIRRGEGSEFYTIAALARRLRVEPTWICRGIRAKRIRARRHPLYGCYLFPRTKAVVERFRQLRRGEVPHITIPQVHGNG
jgi:DNA invertase Pin-like site-specific DNA recombinase